MHPSTTSLPFHTRPINSRLKLVFRSSRRILSRARSTSAKSRLPNSSSFSAQTTPQCHGSSHSSPPFSSSFPSPPPNSNSSSRCSKGKAGTSNSTTDKNRRMYLVIQGGTNRIMRTVPILSLPLPFSLSLSNSSSVYSFGYFYWSAIRANGIFL